MPQKRRAGQLVVGRASMTMSGDVSAGEEFHEQDGGFKGCDCLTGLTARVRVSAGRQRGYAAPGEGVTAPLTHADEGEALARATGRKRWTSVLTARRLAAPRPASEPC